MIAQRPFRDLRESGLLWLINRVVLHPRGYALALHYPDGVQSEIGPTGWSLMGDGSEPWTMGDPSEADRAKYGAKTEDELFALIKELLP